MAPLRARAAAAAAAAVAAAALLVLLPPAAAAAAALLPSSPIHRPPHRGGGGVGVGVVVLAPGRRPLLGRRRRSPRRPPAGLRIRGTAASFDIRPTFVAAAAGGGGEGGDGASDYVGAAPTPESDGGDATLGRDGGPPEGGGGAGVGFDWSAEWYPVSPVVDLDEDAPTKVTLLGSDVAVWYHRPSGRWRAFTDECPHRLVPLSEGRVEADGVLQCAYHGWEFGPEGSCLRIPQLGADAPSPAGAAAAAAVNNPRACATSLPVRVEQGLLWVFPTPDESLAARAAPPALIPELDDPASVDATDFFVRDLPYSWEVLVENLCDPSHIPFAHHTLMRGADRDQAGPLDVAVTEETPRGFRARKDPYPTGGGKYDIRFEAPCLLYYEIVAAGAKDLKGVHDEVNASGASRNDGGASDRPSGTYVGLGSYCVPTAPGRSRLITRFPFRLPVAPVMFLLRRTPRWITHLSQNVVMDSDVVFLSSQDERLDREADRVNPGYYMPARCDAMVSAFRSWLGGPGRAGPEWLGVPAARSAGEPTGFVRPGSIPQRGGRDALLDRYRQHTDVCSSCRGAHRALRALREACLGVGVCLLAVSASGVGPAGAAARRAALAAVGALFLLAPRAALGPLIARLECVPWPRRHWKKPTRLGSLPARIQ